jgi:HK97 family phage major capsid protein
VKTIEEITASMTALVDGAADRSLTDAEVTAYEGMEQELQNVKRTQEIRTRNGAYNTVRTPAGMPSVGGSKKDTYAAAFDNYLRTGKPNADLIQAAQSEGTPSEGGYLVPDLFRTKLVERVKAFGGIGGIAERYTTGNGNPVEWPTIDDTANTGEIVQEGNTFSAGADMVFGSNSLSSYSYVAGGGSSTPLRVSLELLQDTSFDIQGLITRLLGTRIARLQATHLATGTGVNQPLGLITGLTPVQAAANTAMTYNDLVTWIHSVDPAYRANARWVWNDATMAIVEKIADSNGNPVFRGWGANLAIGLNENTVLGYPVTIDQAMPTYVINSHAAADIAIAFGDLGQGYVVRDVRNVELLVNPYSRMANRQVEFTAWARMDATQQDTNAYIVASGK